MQLCYHISELVTFQAAEFHSFTDQLTTSSSSCGATEAGTATKYKHCLEIDSLQLHFHWLCNIFFDLFFKTPFKEMLHLPGGEGSLETHKQQQQTKKNKEYIFNLI